MLVQAPCIQRRLRYKKGPMNKCRERVITAIEDAAETCNHLGDTERIWGWWSSVAIRFHKSLSPPQSYSMIVNNGEHPAGSISSWHPGELEGQGRDPFIFPRIEIKHWWWMLKQETWNVDKKTIPPASWYVPMRRRLSSMRCQWRSSTLSEPFRTYDMFSHPMMPCEMMDDCSIHMPCVLQWFANT